MSVLMVFETSARTVGVFTKKIIKTPKKKKPARPFRKRFLAVARCHPLEQLCRHHPVNLEEVLDFLYQVIKKGLAPTTINVQMVGVPRFDSIAKLHAGNDETRVLNPHLASNSVRFTEIAVWRTDNEKLLLIRTDVRLKVCNMIGDHEIRTSSKPGSAELFDDTEIIRHRRLPNQDGCNSSFRWNLCHC